MSVDGLLFYFFFVINNFFFFSHTTQHRIQNTTKQNNRHILNISRSNQKGGREGRTTRTQKSLLNTITYIHQKTLPSIKEERPPLMIVKCFGCTAIHNKALYKCFIHSFINGRRPGSTDSIVTSLFAGGYGSNMPLYTCVV